MNPKKNFPKLFVRVATFIATIITIVSGLYYLTPSLIEFYIAQKTPLHTLSFSRLDIASLILGLTIVSWAFYFYIQKVKRNVSWKATDSLINDIDKPILMLSLPNEILFIQSDDIEICKKALRENLKNIKVKHVSSRFLSFFHLNRAAVIGSDLESLRNMIFEKIKIPAGHDRTKYLEKMYKAIIGTKDASCQLVLSNVGTIDTPVNARLRYNTYTMPEFGIHLRICTDILSSVTLNGKFLR